MNNKSSSPVGLGVISIFTVLLVLCLTIFSALTLTAAKADWSLSQKNAHTVTAYYQGDSLAVAAYAEFAAGTAPELKKTIPLTASQSLYLHLLREPNGAVRILAWQTIAVEPAAAPADSLAVWDGAPAEPKK